MPVTPEPLVVVATQSGAAAGRVGDLAPYIILEGSDTVYIGDTGSPDIPMAMPPAVIDPGEIAETEEIEYDPKYVKDHEIY